jgi:hypothetical protein
VKDEKELKEDVPEELSGSPETTPEAVDPVERMSAILSPKRDYEISEGEAFKQMGDFMDYYDINVNDIVISEGPDAIETILNRLIRGIRSGMLEIKLDAKAGIIIEQHLKYSPEPTTLRYSKLVARHKKAMGGSKDDEVRMIKFVAAITSIPEAEIGKLVGPDMSIMSRLATLFMVV